MRERCGGISGNACELASLEEAAMEEWIFSSDDVDEVDDVGGGALDGLQAKYLDFRTVPPAEVSGGSVLAEENDGDCVGESGLVFDPGEYPTWPSGTRAESDQHGMDRTVLAVGDAYGEELACSMEQDQTSVGGLLGEISDVESVDPPWASTVGDMTFVSQVLACGVTSGIKGNVCPKSDVRSISLGSVSALGRLSFVGEVEIGPHSFVKPNSGTHHVFDPGEEVCVIAMNHTGLESSSVGAECWPRRLEEGCQDKQSGTATHRDGSCSRGGPRCADAVKPVLRLRGGGSVPRKQGCRKSGGGRRIKPPAKRRRLAEAGSSAHDTKSEL